MRRSYDPGYGSREQLKDCHELGMKTARERDELKRKNDENTGHIQELLWRLEDLTEKLTQLEITNNSWATLNNALLSANEVLMQNLADSNQLLDSFIALANEMPK